MVEVYIGLTVMAISILGGGCEIYRLLDMKNIHVSYAYGLIIIRNIKRGTADFRQTVASRYSPVNPSEKRGTIVNLRWNSIQSLPCGDSTT